MIKTGSWSPWGTIDSVTPVGNEGAAFVTTPGHGGMYLPFLLARQMPAYLVEESFLGSDTWWEEDCDAAWPTLVLGLGSGKDMIRAADFLRDYKPDLLATWQGDDSFSLERTTP